MVARIIGLTDEQLMDETEKLIEQAEKEIDLGNHELAALMLAEALVTAAEVFANTRATKH